MNFNTDRLSHSYIADSIIADTVAMAVVCSKRDGKRPCGNCNDCDKASRRIHPDIIEVGKLDSKNIISVDSIRELKHDVYILPNDSMQKAYLVRDADAMNINAQNALLQVLEEPPKHAVFILSTDNPAALLPTVRSRCVELRAEPGSGEPDENADTDEAEKMAQEYINAIAGNNVKLMECMFRMDKLDKQAFRLFLEISREKIIDTIKANTDKKELCSKYTHTDGILQKAGEMLDLNVNPGSVAGYICANVL